jgi:hypothetical protein
LAPLLPIGLAGVKDEVSGPGSVGKYTLHDSDAVRSYRPSGPVELLFEFPEKLGRGGLLMMELLPELPETFGAAGLLQLLVGGGPRVLLDAISHN